MRCYVMRADSASRIQVLFNPAVLGSKTFTSEIYPSTRSNHHQVSYGLQVLSLQILSGARRSGLNHGILSLWSEKHVSERTSIYRYVTLAVHISSVEIKMDSERGRSRRSIVFLRVGVSLPPPVTSGTRYCLSDYITV